MRKKILFLENDLQFVKAIKQTFHSHVIKCAENLLVFDSAIYGSPGIDAFDLVLIDLALNFPPDIIELYKKEIPDLYVESLVKANITRLDAKIYLYGWDYYQRVIRHRDKTKECAHTKFALISGHTVRLKKKKLYPESIPSNVELLDKGSPDLYDKIREFLK
jgi:hypothetical protein